LSDRLAELPAAVLEALIDDTFAARLTAVENQQE
jgi:hypothetical protein